MHIRGTTGASDYGRTTSTEPKVLLYDLLGRVTYGGSGKVEYTYIG